MKEGISPVFHIALSVWIAFSISASAETARVAVAGDPSLANLVDVTSAELSKIPELTVLDRADLDKLGHEQEIQDALGSQDFHQLQVLPADGLVLFRSATADGKSGVFARLVAVQPGVVLREFALPEGADPTAQAQALAKEFAPYWRKLAAIKKGGISALSLLGLRFDIDTPQSRDLERNINMLLASRLGAEPNTLVLERWRLNDAVFEKAFMPQQPSPFWTGSSLIDGGLRLDSGSVSVSLRVRPPKGPEVTIMDKDTIENLPALAERLADKIQNEPASTTGWDSSTEATRYAELGKWCLDNRLYDESTQAIESALALGNNPRTTHLFLIEAYALQASLSGMKAQPPETDNYLSDGFSPDTLPLRVSAATNAARLTTSYMQTNRDFSSQRWTLEDPVDLGVPILHICLQTLRLAYDHGYASIHPDELTDLRHACQKLISDLGDKLLPQPASYTRGDFLDDRAYYAGLWHDTPEETLAFYREILKSKPVDGAWTRNMLFRTMMVHQPYLDGEGTPFTQSKRNFGPPWIVAWGGSSQDELKTLWQNFLKELAASPDPVLQADALKFEMNSDYTKEARMEVSDRFIALIKAHPDCISGPRGDEFVTGLLSMYFGINSEKSAAAYADLVDLYVNLFKQQVILPTEWVNEIQGLAHGKNPDAVKSLLAGIQDYARWYPTKIGNDWGTQCAVNNALHAIYLARPELAAPPPVQPTMDALPVNHLWDNRSPDATDPKKLVDFSIDCQTLVPEGKNIWFMEGGEPRKIFCVDTSTQQIVNSFPIPEKKHVYDPNHLLFPSHPAFLEVTPLWLAAGLNGQVMLCSRSDGQWKTLDLPPSFYKPRWVNQQLYLIYDAVGTRMSERDPAGLHSTASGLIQVSLEGGTTKGLVNSRRIPPESALDGKPLGVALDLWSSQAGLTIAFDDFDHHLQIYAAPSATNNWSTFLFDSNYDHVKVTNGGAVIGTSFNIEGFSQLIGINQNGRQLFLSNPSKLPPDDKDKPLWNCPYDVRTMVCPVMRGNDLCLFYQDRAKEKAGIKDGTQWALYYFSEGQKDGIKIPLAFDLKQIKNFDPSKLPSLGASFEQLQANDYGIIIGQSEYGFWVIPWGDIDAYRSKAGAGAKPADAATSANK